jgi:26S proteasome regulatory subunit N3
MEMTTKPSEIKVVQKPGSNNSAYELEMNGKHANSAQAFLADVKRCIGWIERSARERNSRFIVRALRLFVPLRRRLNLFAYELPDIVNAYVASPGLASLIREALNGLNLSKPSDSVNMEMTEETTQSDEKMDTDYEEVNESSWTQIYSREVEVFVALLCMVFLLDRKEISRGLALADAWTKVLRDENRRSLDLLAARVYFYFARFYELSNNVINIRG